MNNTTQKSVRSGYEELGIEGYYKTHSADYNNPHIKELEYLLIQEINKDYFGTNILDLCCGSGEVTNILKQYERKSFEKALSAIEYVTLEKDVIIE